MIFFFGRSRNARLDHLRQTGVHGKGFVTAATRTKHQQNGGEESSTYSLDVTYYEQTGQSHRTGLEVPLGIYQTIVKDGEHFRPFAPIDVIYDPSNPAFARASGQDLTTSPWDYWVGIPMFAVGALLLLAAIFAQKPALAAEAASRSSEPTGPSPP